MRVIRGKPWGQRWLQGQRILVVEAVGEDPHHLGMVHSPKEKVLVSRDAAPLHQEGKGREQGQAVATVTTQGFPEMLLGG